MKKLQNIQNEMGKCRFYFVTLYMTILKFYNYGKRKEKHKATKHEADG